ncbi:MAG: PfkB family carbohydrate kinase [Acidobacteriota bacterium]
MPKKPDMMKLLRIIEKFKALNVAVYGDFVLDEFIYGEISRVSREAPVLILNYKHTLSVPGGGANSVNNIRSLDAHPIPVGIVGRDEAGSRLLNLFKNRGIETSLVIVEKGYDTPVKTRILAGSAHTTKQQVVRMDRAKRGFHLPSSSKKRLGRLLLKAMERSNGLLIADYDHGAVHSSLLSDAYLSSRSILTGREKDFIVTLDSRKKILEYQGVTAATPNEEEIENALNIKIGNDEERLRSEGVKLQMLLRAKALLVTRGSKGMSLFEDGRHIADIPVYGTDEVADVTGAGDTVISTFTLSLLAGGSSYESAIIANYAGGIVVMKRGTATVSRSELINAIKSDYR